MFQALNSSVLLPGCSLCSLVSCVNWFCSCKPFEPIRVKVLTVRLISFKNPNVFTTFYVFSRAYHRSRVFPLEAPFSSRVFPRLPPFTCFPALSSGYMFHINFWQFLRTFHSRRGHCFSVLQFHACFSLVYILGILRQSLRPCCRKNHSTVSGKHPPELHMACTWIG